MADYQTIMRALRNAHTAGDTEAARRLARMARQAKAAEASAPAATEDVGQRGDGSYRLPGDPSPEYRDKELKTSEKAQRDAIRQEFDNLPTWQKPLVAADDLVRSAVDGLTFGYGDKLISKITGEDERAKTDAAKTRAGSAGFAAEVGGAALPATRVGKLAEGGLRAVSPALDTTKSVLTRYGLLTAEGAGTGALNAAGHDQNVRQGAVTGALGGFGGAVVGDLISSGLGAVTRRFGRSNVPTKEALEASRDAAYKAAEDAGVVYTPDAIRRIRDNTVQHLTDMGYDPAIQPNVGAVLARLDNLSQGNVTLKGLDTLRKVASKGHIAGKDGAANNAMLAEIIDQIDDVIASPRNSDIIMGDAAKGGAAVRSARDYARRVNRLEDVDRATGLAELRASSTGVGGNADNAMRQNVRRLVERPRGFTADEQRALERVVRGTTPQNLLRLAGRLSPTANGLTMGANVGAFFGSGMDPRIAAGAAGAWGSKQIADQMTVGNIQRARDLIAAGGDSTTLNALRTPAQRFADEANIPLSQILSQAFIRDEAR